MSETNETAETIETAEMWDILDADGKKIGRFVRRGDELKEGEYHLVLHIWIKNSKGEYLISKRCPNKDFGNLWECTGGSAIAGEDSLTAALRETKEELGLTLNPDKGEMIYSLKRLGSFHNIVNVWMFRDDFDISDVVLQEGETCDAKWASQDEINRMIVSGEFIPVEYIEYLYDMFEKY